MKWGLKRWNTGRIGVLLLIAAVFMLASAGKAITSDVEYSQSDAIEVTLSTIDGVDLVGNHYIGSHDRMVIVLNGLLQGKDSGSKQYFCRKLAEYYDVLNIDYRGRGRSGGHFTDGTKEVFDLQAAITFAQARGYTQIAVVGFSFGGYLGIKGSALSGGVGGIVTIGAPYGIQKEMAAELDQEQVGIYKIGEMVIKTLFGSRSPETSCEESSILDPYLDSMTIPLLIMHGNQDSLVPYANAKSILRAAGESKTFITLDGYNHAESLNYAQLDAVLRKVITWLTANLAGSITSDGEKNALDKVV